MRISQFSGFPAMPLIWKKKENWMPMSIPSNFREIWSLDCHSCRPALCDWSLTMHRMRDDVSISIYHPLACMSWPEWDGIDIHITYCQTIPHLRPRTGPTLSLNEIIDWVWFSEIPSLIDGKIICLGYYFVLLHPFKKGFVSIFGFLRARTALECLAFDIVQNAVPLQETVTFLDQN